MYCPRNQLQQEVSEITNPPNFLILLNNTAIILNSYLKFIKGGHTDGQIRKNFSSLVRYNIENISEF
jgi:hypothetical protein